VASADYFGTRVVERVGLRAHTVLYK